MQIPSDKTLYQDEVAVYWMEDDLLCGVAKPAPRTVENLSRTFELIADLTSGKKVCLLSDISQSGSRTEEARKVLADLSSRHFKAMALVAESSYGRLVGNTFITLSGSPMPMQLYASESEARLWLRAFMRCP